MSTPVMFLIAGAIIAVVTLIRFLIANNHAEQEQQAGQEKRESLEQQMTQLLAQHSATIRRKVSSQCVCMGLDETQQTLYVVTSAGQQESRVIPLQTLSGAQLVDKSSQYKHIQEMERYYSGVTRGTMTNPYGPHSTREVRDGHALFSSWSGKAVFGIVLLSRDAGTPVSIPFYRAGTSVLWNEDEALQKCKNFVEYLNQQIKAAGSLESQQ